MSGTVRNRIRYVLVSYDGVVNEDFVIFVDNSSAVTVYTAAGETFDGDLLALETFAALNKSYAVPVEPPSDFTGEVKEVSHPSEDVLAEDEKVVDWSEDPAIDSGSEKGVNLAHAEDEVPPVKEASISAAIIEKIDDAALLTGGMEAITPGEHPIHAGVTPDGVVQGKGIYDNLFIADRSRKINLPGTVVPLELITHISPENYGTAVRKKRIPNKPMVLFRDLGPCLMGMPTWVGTTIAGPLRPDTGGKDPSIADHDMWRQYGVTGGPFRPP
jgi:hypothetical protein